MKQIGLLSDTHAYLHPDLPRIFGHCDEIWHAGDFGSMEVVDGLSGIRPLRGVYGNIDGQEIRLAHPEVRRFQCEQVDVLMMHIGGYPGRYAPKALSLIKDSPPRLFISGHSHILRIQYDKRHGLLYINPGAAGKTGFHKVITMVRFVVDGDRIRDLEIVEFPRR
jgi:uncharacterized protein